MSGPQRTKALIADQKSGITKAIQPDFLEGSSAAETAFLQNLKLRRDLGLIDDSLVRRIAGHQSPESVLQMRLLEKLGRFGSTDPVFLQISSVLGTSDRMKQSAMLARKYTNSALLRRVMQNIVGTDQNLAELGQDEVNADLARSERNRSDDPMVSIADVSFQAPIAQPEQ